jgi:hypothetical protein
MQITLERTESLYKMLLEQKGVPRLNTHAETRSL